MTVVVLLVVRWLVIGSARLELGDRQDTKKGAEGRWQISI